MKKIFFFSITIFIALIIILSSFEYLIRATNRAPNFYTIPLGSVNTDEETNSSQEGTYQISNNPILLYEPKPLTGFFNKHGIRGKEISQKKSIPRIFFVGDSVGYGINLKQEEIFIQHLNNHFKNKYDFYNFSVPGYSLRQYIEVIKEKILPHSPDQIYILICENDFRK